MNCPFQTRGTEAEGNRVYTSNKECDTGCALYCNVGSCCSLYYLRDVATELYEIRRAINVLRT